MGGLWVGWVEEIEAVGMRCWTLMGGCRWVGGWVGGWVTWAAHGLGGLRGGRESHPLEVRRPGEDLTGLAPGVAVVVLDVVETGVGGWVDGWVGGVEEEKETDTQTRRSENQYSGSRTALSSSLSGRISV